MGGLKYRLGPGYLELPFATDGLLKGLILFAAGTVAYFVERELDKAWGLSAEGFYVLKGIYCVMFLGAFACFAYSRVVRLENRISRIVVKKGIRLFHILPVMWTYECDEITVEYVPGRGRDGSHGKAADFWRIRGVGANQSFMGKILSDLAIFSNREDAGAFMRHALDFVRATRDDLSPSTKKAIRLIPD